MRSLICLLLFLTTPALAAPWDEPFGEPAAILAAADGEKARADESMQVLLEEMVFTVDEQLRVHRAERLVYRLVDQDAVDNDSGIWASWQPRYQDRPVVRARVVLPDGTAVDLEPEGLVEVKPGANGENVYRDYLGLEGPLPRLTSGAIVERQITTAAHGLFYDAGSVTQFRLRWPQTPRRRVVEVRSPPGVKLTFAGYDLGKPARSKDGKTVVHRWDLGPEEDPPYVSRRPRTGDPSRVVRFTTGRSWKDIATSYAAHVDAQLAGVDLAAIATEAAGGAQDPVAITQNAFDWVRAKVRYTGLEFGENALVPVPPSVTLERGFGDCKDQSTLLVGILRHHGIDAHVALISAGSWFDVDPKLPGMGVFDHAIVYAAGVDLWMDPTEAHSPAGHIRPALMGRRSLIAAPGEGKLRVTPALDGADHRMALERTYRMGEEGPATVDVHLSAVGSEAVGYREGWSDTSDEEAREFLEGVVEKSLSGEGVDAIRVVGANEPHVPFELGYTGHDVWQAFASGDYAAVNIDPGEVLGSVDGFLWPPEKPPETPRSEPAGGVYAHSFQVVTRSRPPRGFVLERPPDEVELTAGPARFLVKTVPGEDEVVTTVRFEIAGGEEITAEDLSAIRDLVQRVDGLDEVQLLFVHRSKPLVESGQTEQAFESARNESELGAAQELRRARLLTAAGLPWAAALLAERWVEDERFKGQALKQLLEACSMDPLGNDQAPGWARDCALEAATALTELAPDDSDAWLDLAIVQEVDARGYVRGPAVDSAAAARSLLRSHQLGAGDGVIDFAVGDALASADPVLMREIYDQLSTPMSAAAEVSLLAVRDGQEAAARRARALGGSEPGAQTILVEAQGTLFHTGHYDIALSLLRSVVGPGAAPDLLQALQVQEFLEDHRNSKNELDPAVVPAHKVLQRAIRGELGPPLEECFTETALQTNLGLEAYADTLLKSWALMVPISEEAPVRTLEAVLLGGAEFEVEVVHPDVRRVKMRVSTPVREGEWLQTLVSVRTPEGWRIAGSDHSRSLAGEARASLA